MTSSATSAMARAAAGEMPLSVQVLPSFTKAETRRTAWNELVLRSGADIYQTFDWCRLWWQYYGHGRELNLLLFHCGEELVGLVPAFIEILWLGPVRLRVARLVGADFTLHLCNLPVVSEHLPAIISQTIQHFLGRLRCDLLLFGPLSGPASRMDEILASARAETSLVGSADLLGDSCNTFFKLPEIYDDYLKAVGKQQRGNLNRTVAQFSKAHRVAFDVVSQRDKVVAEFEGFRTLHDAQWRAEGKLGHFGDWPHAERFNRDLVQTLGAQDLVRFHRILADDQVVSSQFTFAFGPTNYWRLPARVFAPEWDRLSFGRMGLAKMIEASIGEGRRLVEGGRGHYAYKVQMGGQEWPLRTIQLMRRDPGVAARVHTFRFFASLLNIAYYKIVFMRLAPRFSALRRPLWPRWVRSSW